MWAKVVNIQEKQAFLVEVMTVKVWFCKQTNKNAIVKSAFLLFYYYLGLPAYGSKIFSSSSFEI